MTGHGHIDRLSTRQQKQLRDCRDVSEVMDWLGDTTENDRLTRINAYAAAEKIEELNFETFKARLRKQSAELAKEYDLPDIIDWRQGHFVDQKQYDHWNPTQKAHAEEREQTLIRPGGGTNNALFMVDGSMDDKNIAAYLQAVGKMIGALDV